MTTVLVTGATGFLGGAFAAHLRNTRPEIALVATARAHTHEAARERVARSLHRFGASVGGVEVLAIDLDASGLHALPFEGLDLIVHFAPTSSIGTLALARTAIERGALRRFIYVGSAWSCGAGRRGVVCEDERTEPPHLFPYLAEKLRAEEQLADLLGARLLITRPSLVLGHTTLGCAPSASLAWILRLADQLRSIPWALEQALDVVPVDWVGASIERLLFVDSSLPRRLHLSAGSMSATWGSIEEWFTTTREERSRWRRAPRHEWMARAEAALGSTPATSRALHQGAHFFAGGAVFDNRRMLAAGVPSPPRLDTYIQRCLTADDRSIAEQALDDV